MPSFKSDDELRLIVHLPDDADHGRFHFQLLRMVGGSMIDVPLEAAAILHPMLAPHLPLHECDGRGVPNNVLTQAWYHLSGVFFPDEPYADHVGTTGAGHRLRRLLRMSARHYNLVHQRFASFVREFKSPEALHTELEATIFDQGPRWAREAESAMNFIPQYLPPLEAHRE